MIDPVSCVFHHQTFSEDAISNYVSFRLKPENPELSASEEMFQCNLAFGNASF